MNPSSLAGHVIELCELFDQNSSPPDSHAAEFFRARRYLGSHDRRVISGAVYGIVRHRRFLEALLEQFLSEHPDAADLNKMPARYVPLYAAYMVAVEHCEQKDALTALGSRWRAIFPNTDCPNYCTWLSANLALGFLNGASPLVRLGVKYSFQDWMVERWHAQMKTQTEPLLQSLNSSAPITIRVNTLKTDRDQCRTRLLSEGIESEPTRYSRSGLIVKKRFNRNTLESFRDGCFEMQDEGSQIISELCGVKPGDVVIDACAGAGGKTLHLAELMENNGAIAAIDIDEHRLFELQSRAERAGVKIVSVYLANRFPQADFDRKADLVLVDAPCSGSGTIRRNPNLKWTIDEDLVARHAARQKELLAINSAFVKPGGKLIYATCSLFADENEEVVNEFLKSNTAFSLNPPSSLLTEFGLSADSGMVRLLPHVNGTDGFFVAVMKRVS
ncbi:MAG TPA: RsmB/NOP family class I SAM-dependent RNA methyltransferase [Bacteroidota bacterium]|nr:RsmB/NOP family class I SAM-dependent RNA methyltransferase [Bacteroidota bacterium]